MSKRYCLTPARKDRQDLILQYEEHHKKLRPGTISSIRDPGIEYKDPLFERKSIRDGVNDTFSLMKGRHGKNNNKVQPLGRPEALPASTETSGTGRKWLPMNKIFDLNEQ